MKPGTLHVPQSLSSSGGPVQQNGASGLQIVCASSYQREFQIGTLLCAVQCHQLFTNILIAEAIESKWKYRYASARPTAP
jgi:hypothetical protein